mmetsp:Transcript_8445/g.15903  ORF Transcript_8445/g.15903 Transcript_8445/m.15903 type:complete len:204 (+) Transcript_8445:223-834(+)|eukprot:CAMPEP_0172718454 /NCGR_PEP_ID=MMETSP1074-20121228/74435_1 /TAXON_ID=2916 /ORGANISM="Ceratium fusus, Strain PA161109" /LENGTH=203 /DNA_ID=CAMNT_0013543655 /DNA_START=180 /DNA_END=788 /DNA_ORIENTATION=-
MIHFNKPSVEMYCVCLLNHQKRYVGGKLILTSCCHIQLGGDDAQRNSFAFERLVVLLKDLLNLRHRTVLATALGEAAPTLLETHVQPPDEEHKATTPAPAPTTTGRSVQRLADLRHHVSDLLFSKASRRQGFMRNLTVCVEHVEVATNTRLHYHHVHRRPLLHTLSVWLGNLSGTDVEDGLCHGSKYKTRTSLNGWTGSCRAA